MIPAETSPRAESETSPQAEAETSPQAEAKNLPQAENEEDLLGVVLPEGEGKEILVRACTNCHDLGGLALFKGYYTEELWREIVVDMVRVGAQVREDEIPVVTRYLTEHFGPELEN